MLKLFACNVPRWSAVGVLLAPGMLAAAIVFSQGINSDWGKTYLVLAALMNAFLLAWAGVLVLDVDRALSAAGLTRVQREIPEEFLRLPLLMIDCSARSDYALL